MSRSWLTNKASDGWIMMCDKYPCGTRIGPRPKHNDFPLEHFAWAGWFVGQKGDLCPTCFELYGSSDDALKVMSEVPRMPEKTI